MSEDLRRRRRFPLLGNGPAPPWPRFFFLWKLRQSMSLVRWRTPERWRISNRAAEGPGVLSGVNDSINSTLRSNGTQSLTAISHQEITSVRRAALTPSSIYCLWIFFLCVSGRYSWLLFRTRVYTVPTQVPHFRASLQPKPWPRF